ncbi:hypothetical protein, partial [Brevibacterium daeguense]|uniref:hypothetical protein n=1 Tax=Brevibacterium daeguense TaxID=909936 RepID=UPI001F35A335
MRFQDEGNQGPGTDIGTRALSSSVPVGGEMPGRRGHAWRQDFRNPPVRVFPVSVGLANIEHMIESLQLAGHDDVAVVRDALARMEP